MKSVIVFLALVSCALAFRVDQADRSLRARVGAAPTDPPEKPCWKRTQWRTYTNKLGCYPNTYETRNNCDWIDDATKKPVACCATKKDGKEYIVAPICDDGVPVVDGKCALPCPKDITKVSTKDPKKCIVICPSGYTTTEFDGLCAPDDHAFHGIAPNWDDLKADSLLSNEIRSFSDKFVNKAVGLTGPQKVTAYVTTAKYAKILQDTLKKDLPDFRPYFANYIMAVQPANKPGPKKNMDAYYEDFLNDFRDVADGKKTVSESEARVNNLGGGNFARWLYRLSQVNYCPNRG
eukprot:TRINITY_DN832_c0_g1_i1.p1 TRINITY_DN832_c0_g1~~TRINITY_DN832_c0_g1_i1.p1  ORF type:complete len:292 (+),score=118.10 TRINITY_DN832_c0_g1_i1:61-936(+)